MMPTRTLTHGWTQSATGRCGIWTGSLSRSCGRIWRRCCAFPESTSTSARRIVSARRCGGPLRFEDLQKLGVVLKRAQYSHYLRWADTGGLHFSPCYAALQLERLERGTLPSRPGCTVVSL